MCVFGIGGCVLMHRETFTKNWFLNLFCQCDDSKSSFFKTHVVLSVEIGVDADEILDEGKMAVPTCINDRVPVISLLERRKKKSVPLVCM